MGWVGRKVLLPTGWQYEMMVMVKAWELKDNKSIGKKAFKDSNCRDNVYGNAFISMRNCLEIEKEASPLKTLLTLPLYCKQIFYCEKLFIYINL